MRGGSGKRKRSGLPGVGGRCTQSSDACHFSSFFWREAAWAACAPTLKRLIQSFSALTFFIWISYDLAHCAKRSAFCFWNFE